MAAAWPTVAKVKQALGIDNNARDAMLADAIGAAIEQVAVDVGYHSIEVETPEATPVLNAAIEYNDEDEPVVVEVAPSYALSQAALILTVMTVKAPDAPFGIAAVFDTGGLKVAAEHPTYLRMLQGEHLLFGVA